MMEGQHLTAHFCLEEFTQSATAAKHGICNEPPIDAISNLQNLCQQVLEPLREHYGRAIHISSGYRCKELNRRVGGVANSQHLKGEAADPVTEYISEGSNPKEYVLKGNGIDEQDIDIAFACYGQKNSHMLFPSVGFSRPQYPYMFRKRQQVKVAYQDYMGGKINPDLYMRNVVWKGTTMRVISAKYSADYEQTTLTLQET